MLPSGPASEEERRAGFADAAIPNPDGPSLWRPSYLKAVVAKFGPLWVVKAWNPDTAQISYVVWTAQGHHAQPSARSVEEVKGRFGRLRLVPQPSAD